MYHPTTNGWHINADPDSANLPHQKEFYNQDFGGYTIQEEPIFTKRPIRLVCVGAGATGLQLAYKAERLLKNVTLQIYEKNSDIGGTWLENIYPGVACDIPSHVYQFQWARNPSWSQFYAPGQEIWQYFKDVATKFNLERYVKFSHRVLSAKWDDVQGVWKLTIQTPDGGTMEDECEILVNASGILNKWKWPKLPGMETFKGKLMHSAAWDADFDLTGKTVAVIGGASSAVQIVTQLQPQVKKLIPFIRSSVWVTMGAVAKFAGPGGTNFHYSKEQIQSFRDDPEKYDEYCRAMESEMNSSFKLLHRDGNIQQVTRDMVSELMSTKLNRDEILTEHLIPKFGLGCRRIIPGPGYLEALKKDNVEVVKQGVVRFTEKGVVDESGKEHEVDVVVCATGFDTSYAPHFECTGLNGTKLKEKFGDYPQGYLSIMVDEFPNFYYVFGPNGPANHAGVIPLIEWYTRYIFQMINKLQTDNIKSFTPKAECVRDFTQHTHVLMKRLVWSDPCSSWYKNGKTNGPVTANWPGSRLHYMRAMSEPRYEDFDIVYRGNNRFQYMGNGFTEDDLQPGSNLIWYMDDPFLTM